MKELFRACVDKGQEEGTAPRLEMVPVMPDNNQDVCTVELSGLSICGEHATR